jgi:hypothetical protein
MESIDAQDEAAFDKWIDIAENAILSAAKGL